ncbi:excinuclease ABC subunit UvrA [Paenibacillus sp. J5C_2022]|uniref:excinuclease ABC subunit UvrA n=1 Tax=Paenibacillus sp. J5C2022 TaxID=2977129 RepID=UPI0021D2D2A0|nr:excinuclease ABC subunit UvrA [Paenibacillus sp. J5C2022]MCU6707382.1 excinuclease ABC subunit UvrA [Paenibacillus sp. J5C2022]
MSNMIVKGAWEGNLKNVDVEIPKGKLIVLTGLSGSGKSTLAIDVIFHECQRQYLEAIGLQGIHKPKVESIRHLSPAIMISQSESNRNPRSTVGTLTNMYTDLRLVFEKLSVRVCPGCCREISSGDCREEVEKRKDEFKVYMSCVHCGHRMEKLTRTHFSHNTREGACPTCEGLGKVMSIDKEQTIDESLSLEEGAVHYWGHKYKEYQISALYSAFRHYGLSVANHAPVAEYSPLQKVILLHGTDSVEVKRAFPNIAAPRTVADGKFEGVISTLWRRLSEKEGEAKKLERYFVEEVCSSCEGERLAPLGRSATIEEVRLPQLSAFSLDQLQEWIGGLKCSLSERHLRLIEDYMLDLNTKLQRISNVGLSYLSLDRQMTTLSGGEKQRIKLAAALDSNLSGIIYILDEPTVGLHPKDTAGMMTILAKLRDLGNTVIVIEHDPDVMRAADYLIDIGPGSGKHGGEIIARGTWEELLRQEDSVTGSYFKRKKQERRTCRRGTGEMIKVEGTSKHNLRNVHVSFPIGCLTTVTGVSGSGKSTLVFDVLAAEGDKRSASPLVAGMEQFDQVITIEQSAITRMKRSNVATYSDVYTEIRKIFGGLAEAKERGLNAKHFSFNSPGGRCEECEGLGYVMSNMLFFQDIEVTCPTCGGNQFNEEVLSVAYSGYSIKDILQLSIDEALLVFRDHAKLIRPLQLLQEVGLGYVELGQSLTTLSGGEGQRLKLARELMSHRGKPALYLMDEPTTGLHPLDVESFIKLLHRMVDAGSTVIAVEHNQQVMAASDWIIDLGPEGGVNGGQVMFTGTPQNMIEQGESVTAEHLRSSH